MGQSGDVASSYCRRLLPSLTALNESQASWDVRPVPSSVHWLHASMGGHGFRQGGASMLHVSKAPHCTAAGIQLAPDGLACQCAAGFERARGDSATASGDGLHCSACSVGAFRTASEVDMPACQACTGNTRALAGAGGCEPCPSTELLCIGGVARLQAGRWCAVCAEADSSSKLLQDTFASWWLHCRQALPGLVARCPLCQLPSTEHPLWQKTPPFGVVCPGKAVECAATPL